MSYTFPVCYAQLCRFWSKNECETKWLQFLGAEKVHLFTSWSEFDLMLIWPDGGMIKAHPEILKKFKIQMNNLNVNAAYDFNEWNEQKRRLKFE